MLLLRGARNCALGSGLGVSGLWRLSLLREVCDEDLSLGRNGFGEKVGDGGGWRLGVGDGKWSLGMGLEGVWY